MKYEKALALLENENILGNRQSKEIEAPGECEK